MRRWLRLILAFAAVHFAASMLTGVIGFGLDFDQVRSRSAVSRVAAAMHDILMGPHSLAIRSLPRGWLPRFHAWLVPLMLILHDLAWGAVVAIIWRLASDRRSGRRRV